jgi:hypothetical protein
MINKVAKMENLFDHYASKTVGNEKKPPVSSLALSLAMLNWNRAARDQG